MKIAAISQQLAGRIGGLQHFQIGETSISIRYIYIYANQTHVTNGIQT